MFRLLCPAPQHAVRSRHHPTAALCRIECSIRPRKRRPPDATTGSKEFVTQQQRSHHLYFASLFHPGRALSFPCDRNGEARLDGLSMRSLDDLKV